MPRRSAEALLAGDARDTEALLRLAERLLGGQRAPLGADIVGLLHGMTVKRPGSPPR